MLSHRLLVASALFVLLPFAASCGGSREAEAHRGEHGGEHGGEGRGERGGEHGGEGRGEHDRDGAEHGGGHGDEGEESGEQFARGETYDRVRKGARLILKYDAVETAFVGTVENTTDATLERVRVEVHLSNGKEIGPTTPADLPAHQKRDVRLPVTNADFERWSAHAEVGSGEHR